MTQTLAFVFNLLAQTAAQKSATFAMFGCVLVLFVVLCMDKCKYSKSQKTILLSFLALFLVAFILIYFLVIRKK